MGQTLQSLAFVGLILILSSGFFQVNTMCWNESGSLILSGSDDQYLKITDPFNRNVSYQLCLSRVNVQAYTV